MFRVGWLHASFRSSRPQATSNPETNHPVDCASQVEAGSWTSAPRSPGPRVPPIPPVVNRPHVPLGHQLPEGLRALVGGYVGRQGRRCRRGRPCTISAGSEAG